MRFTWSERKRAIHLREHGLDFLDAPRVFEGLTLTYEDDRFAYGDASSLWACWQVYQSQSHIRSQTMKSESFPSVKPPTAKTSGSSTKSKTDSSRLMSPGQEGHATEEHPEFDPSHLVRAIVRRGLAPVPSKELISLRIDQDVIEWFKAQGPRHRAQGIKHESTQFCGHFATHLRPEGDSRVLVAPPEKRTAPQREASAAANRLQPPQIQNAGGNQEQTAGHHQSRVLIDCTCWAKCTAQR